MKRSETFVGQEVVVGSYGQKAIVVSMDPWEQGRGFSGKPHRVDRGSGVAIAREVGSFGSGPNLWIGEVTTLGALRPVAAYEAEKGRERKAREERDLREKANSDRIARLPEGLGAGAQWRPGAGLLLGFAVVKLDALEDLVRRAERA